MCLYSACVCVDKKRCVNYCSTTNVTPSNAQRFDTRPEVTAPSTLKPVGAELPVKRMSSLPLRRSTSGRMAPSSPLTRHSTSASTTVVADVHRDASELAPSRTTSGLSPRPRDQRGPEVVVPRQLPGQRQRLAAGPEDRRCRVLRHPVSECSAAAERDQRQWTSLEHSAVDTRRSASIERPTRRVHSYEDRYLLQRQKGMQPAQVAMPHVVRRRLPNVKDPLRITEFSTADDDDDFGGARVYHRPRVPISPARQ